jgi:3-hydroxybutyryl-CoA dehydrogenase
MKILIVGESEQAEECKTKLGTGHSYTLVADYSDIKKQIKNHDLIFDFVIDEEPEEFQLYAGEKCTVFVNTAKMSLAELSYLCGNDVRCTVFGFNGLPTFFNRSVLEVSVLKKDDEKILSNTGKQLGVEYLLVDDRVGLVTPRVICMIINEAYYTVQEGTATREDIDIAMKLGTNYPFGPFEWCQRIGIRHVYELLDAVYDDTKDERYKICPLLKKEYLAGLI